MRNILNNHPKIGIMPETHFMEEIYPLKDKFSPENKDDLKRLAQKICDRFNTNLQHDETIKPFEFQNFFRFLEENQVKSFRGIFQSMLYFYAQQNNASVAGEKTPRHLYHVDKLSEWFPEAKFLALIRDGRDYMASYKRYSERDISEEESERISSLYHPLLTSLKWRSEVGQVQKIKDTERVKVVCYEDLVSEPSNIVKKLCDFLSLEYTDNLLDIEGRGNTSYEDNQTGITDSSVGRWQNNLEKHEVYLMEKINKNGLTDFDYELSNPAAFWQSIPVVATAPYQFLKALYYNLDRTGDIISYLRCRLSRLIS